MGKARTDTETMEHISLVVHEVALNISSDYNKLLRMIEFIQEKTNQIVKRSDDMIEAYKRRISVLESENSSQFIENGKHSYQTHIVDCQEEISAISSRIQNERTRNNELRQILSQFREQSSQTLKTIKQIDLAAKNANTNGKQYLSK